MLPKYERAFILIILFSSLALMVIFLVGCTSGSYSHTEEFDDLRLTISSPKLYYEVGDTVTVTVVLENVSPDTVILESAGDSAESKYVFDVQVDGQWLSDVKPELRITHQELKPWKKIKVEYGFLPDMQPHTIPIDAYVKYWLPNLLITQHAAISLHYGVKWK